MYNQPILQSAACDMHAARCASVPAHLPVLCTQVAALELHSADCCRLKQPPARCATGSCSQHRMRLTPICVLAMICLPAGPYDPRQYLGGLATVPDSWKVDLPAQRVKAAVPWQQVMDHIHRHGKAPWPIRGATVLYHPKCDVRRRFEHLGSGIYCSRASS
jgi:hypothetical protein